MASKGKTTKEEKEGGRTSATGKTPSPQELGAGVRLEYPYKGTVHKAVVEKTGEGEFVLRVGKQFFKSLSSAAEKISGHASRGGICWRREGETQPLLGRVSYAQAATPAPKRPKAASKKHAGKAAKLPPRKPKAGNGEAGTVRTRSAIKCGEKECTEVFANTADASAHLIEAHPAKS